MRNITIIGGSGFLGKNLIKRLTNWNVTNIDKKPLQEKYLPKNYKEIIGDANNEKVLEKSLKNADVVWIKAAKLATERHKKSAEEEYEKTNVDLPKKILKICERLEIKNIFFDSSDAVFLESWEKNKHRPNSNQCPKDFYGSSKTKTEKILKKWAMEDSERSVQIFRYTRVAYRGSLRLLCLWCIQNQLELPIKIFGNGNRAGCMIHLDDCINANLQGINLTPNFEIYNLTLDPITLNELSKIIIENKNKNGKFIHVEDTFSHTSDPEIHAMDVGETWKKLSYKPKKTIKDIVVETHAFIADELSKKTPSPLKKLRFLKPVKKIIRMFIVKSIKKQGIDI